MKSLKYVLTTLLICALSAYTNAREVEITLVSGSLDALRTQQALLFAVTWDNTLIEGVPEQDYFAAKTTKKNAAKEEQSGKKANNWSSRASILMTE